MVLQRQEYDRLFSSNFQLRDYNLGFFYISATRTSRAVKKDGFSLSRGKAQERKSDRFLLVFLKRSVKPWSKVGRIVYISGHRWCSIKPRQGAGAKKCLIFIGFP